MAVFAFPLGGRGFDAAVVTEHFDAIVVGAGAAGSLIAASLAEAGRRVLVLDAGPGWTAADLLSSPIWSRRLSRATRSGCSPTRRRRIGASPVAA